MCRWWSRQPTRSIRSCGWTDAVVRKDKGKGEKPDPEADAGYESGEEEFVRQSTSVLK
jgi:hypothetical protein